MLRSSFAIGIGAALVAAIAYVPLGWVAPAAVPDGVTGLRYSGSVWNGSITNIPVFDRATARVHPLSRTMDIRAGQGTAFARGNVSRTRAQDVRLILPLERLPLTDGRLQGLSGLIEVEIDEAAYSDAGCTSATGSARTDVLQRNGGVIDWTGPELAGPIRCEAGALVAELTGRDAAQSIAVTLSLRPDGVYRADVTAETSRAEADVVLPIFGFTRDGGVFRLTEQGNWR